MIKKILFALVFTVLALAGVVAFRTMTAQSKQLQAVKALPLPSGPVVAKVVEMPNTRTGT